MRSGVIQSRGGVGEPGEVSGESGVGGDEAARMIGAALQGAGIGLKEFLDEVAAGAGVEGIQECAEGGGGTFGNPKEKPVTWDFSGPRGSTLTMP